jgi:hypothetical protein
MEIKEIFEILGDCALIVAVAYNIYAWNRIFYDKGDSNRDS